MENARAVEEVRQQYRLAFGEELSTDKVRELNNRYPWLTYLEATRRVYQQRLMHHSHQCNAEEDSCTD